MSLFKFLDKKLYEAVYRHPTPVNPIDWHKRTTILGVRHRVLYTDGKYRNVSLSYLKALLGEN